ncbi:AzlD domain-containing protein [Undibacterium sp. 5I1]|uniref:AzlD domain-containing protein n=1 Tax=unclassified Undibacterium TaxID=2630295 RepID=UPI002AB38D3B|nr:MULTISPECIES: AzlD domain-containing protein [unclassified Undibacterium]MDY7539061.1 AzlD domain-containing protein [Undibacterium sp. 5I1]MEB0229805.1 AzlD domain-containing protein [Undibacterium sp. 10I3]MEB0258290.1 AzlD domain-containing protein [Undibacterium sp. 5I1]
MSDLEIWLVIFALAVATFIARSTFWLVGHHINLPKRVQEALRYAPACALAAIIVPDVLLSNGQLSIALDNPKLIAAIAAGGFFLVKRNMLLTIFFGMAVYTYVRLGL